MLKAENVQCRFSVLICSECKAVFCASDGREEMKDSGGNYFQNLK